VTRPTLEVADLIRAQGNRFLDRYRSSFSFQQLKVFRAIQNCRTAALGGHLDSCPRCGHQAISYNSCRNRHCPKCQTQARQRWLACRQQEVLPTAYFHVVFSVPHELNVLALENPRWFYDLLFAAASATLLEVAANPKRLGADIGLIAILHTWGQNLLLHPHIHCVVPAGGLAPGRSHWGSARSDFFLPIPVLRKVFRGKFIAGLKRLRQHGKLCRSGPAALFADPQQWAKLRGRLHLRRFFLHVLPKSFVRIRHFGFLANRFRTPALALCRQLLAVSLPVVAADREPMAGWHCPGCGERMERRQAFTAAELLWRCPVLASS
jgi:Transposase zinc-binding domain/Putative transposase